MTRTSNTTRAPRDAVAVADAITTHLGAGELAAAVDVLESLDKRARGQVILTLAGQLAGLEHATRPDTTPPPPIGEWRHDREASLSDTEGSPA